MWNQQYGFIVEKPKTRITSNSINFVLVESENNTNDDDNTNYGLSKGTGHGGEHLRQKQNNKKIRVSQGSFFLLSQRDSPYFA